MGGTPNPLAQLDPATLAKLQALAARSGDPQSSVAGPAAAPNYSTMAASAWGNPNAQPVQQPQQGLIDPARHPQIAAVINAIAQGMHNFGMTAMDPRERIERQQLAEQKAEAMGRLGMQQQQLGLEGQRVGIEQQRANTEQQGVTQTGAYQTGELAESSKRTKIEQQRADQEYETKKRELDNQTKQLQNETLRTQSEYGKGGLRSQEVAANVSRAATDAKMATIADAREKAEADYRQSQARAAGLQTDRATLEDERKARLAAVHDHFGQNRWYVPNSWTLQWQQEKEQEINDEIDKRIAQAERVAGTGAGAGINQTGSNTNAAPGNQQFPKTAEEWLNKRRQGQP
jgi:hypothetical protein